MSEVRGDAGVLTAGYERLREAILSGEAGGWRLGHGVLSTRGMVAWMSRFSEFAAPAETATETASCAVAADEAVMLRDADEVVAVLAQMVLPLAA